MTRRFDLPLAAARIAVAAVLVGACAGGLGPAASPTTNPTPSALTSPSLSPPPSPSPSPRPSGGTPVSTGAQAAALVLAAEPVFANVSPTSADLVGQCCTYEVTPAPAGWEVSVTVGWGDCLAGCIDRHTWTYQVTHGGGVSLAGESGPEPPADVVPDDGTGPATASVRLVAGPTCPVETVPPDPNCAPRPVANAEVVVRDHLGTDLVRGTSDADGMVALELPAGVYVVEAQPAPGLMGTPEPAAFSVAAGAFVDLTLAYDTGIR